MSLFDTLINWGLRQALGSKTGGAAAQTIMPIVDTIAPSQSAASPAQLTIPKNITDILAALDYPESSSGIVALINTIIADSTRLTATQKSALQVFVDNVILNGGTL
jgi:hypothetical protein